MVEKTSGTSPPFSSFLGFVLRPVATFCVRNSVRLQELTELVKIELVHAAESDLERRGAPVNTSKISIMTGVHRPDVQRVREASGKPKESKNVISRVIGQWSHDSRFLRKDRKPKVLQCEGRGSEFEQLLRTVTLDANPYTVLFELERSGAVARTSKGVKLLSGAHLAVMDAKEGFQILSRDLDDLAISVEENLLGVNNPPNLHIRTEYDNIHPQHLPEIRKRIVEEGKRFSRRIRELLSSFDRDTNKSLKDDSSARARVVVGTFSRTSKETSQE